MVFIPTELSVWWGDGHRNRNNSVLILVLAEINMGVGVRQSLNQEGVSEGLPG